MGIDKVLHFLVSFCMAIHSPALSFLAGIAKELYDSVSGGVADVYDLVADWAGIACAELGRFLS